MRRTAMFLLVVACVLTTDQAAAQELTGTLVGTVKDAQGAVVPGAVVRVDSPALIGGSRTSTSCELRTAESGHSSSSLKFEV
jgi:hypothetical protein